MVNKIFQKAFIPLFFLFIILNPAFLVLQSWLDAKNINHFVLMGANALLFILSALSILIYAKAIQNKNPQVFARAVMAAAFIKLLLLAFATIIYFLLAGQDKSVYAIIVSMGLYILYTIIEVKAAFRINKKGHG